MDIQIKLEPNSGSTCVVCLKTDVQTFGQHEINSEISSIYKDLLKDHLTLLNEIGRTEMCFECMEALNGITEFKKKCVSSIEILSAKMKTVDNFGDEFFSPFESLKEEIFVADLPVQVDMKPDESPRRWKKVIKVKPIKKSRDPETKIKVDTTTVTKQEPVDDQKEEDTVVERKANSKEQKKGYCYICCMSHPTIHRHVLDVHSRTFEDGVLRCLWCQEACANAQGVVDHLKAVHREFEHPKKCGKCDMETKSRETFFKHVHQIHYQDRDRIYLCDYCNAVYNEITTYKYHIWTYHLGAVKCRHCDKSFYDNKAREAHNEEHERRLAASNFTCHFCGYISKYKTLLLKHLLIHHVGIPNIKCDFCDKVYKTRQQLRTHSKRVHEEKQYQCNVCGQRFHNGSTLRKHVKHRHTDNVVKPFPKKQRPETREFACDQCDMKFYVKGTLKKHKFTHTKTRPYQCHMCSTGYYMNDYLRKHYLREHDTIYSPKEIRKMCGRKRFDDSD